MYKEHVLLQGVKQFFCKYGTIEGIAESLETWAVASNLLLWITSFSAESMQTSSDLVISTFSGEIILKG